MNLVPIHIAILALVTLTGCNAGSDSALLQYFLDINTGSASQDIQVMAKYVPADGIVMVDHVNGNGTEMRVSKDRALAARAHNLKLQSADGYVTGEAPHRIATESGQRVAYSRMFEVSPTQNARVVGVLELKTVFGSEDGHLVVVRSELLAFHKYKIENVE